MQVAVVILAVAVAVSAGGNLPGQGQSKGQATNWETIQQQFGKIQDTIIDSMTEFVRLTDRKGCPIGTYVQGRKVTMNDILNTMGWNIESKRLNQEIAFELLGMIHYYVEEQMYVFRSSVPPYPKIKELETKYNETNSIVMDLNHGFFAILPESPKPAF